MLDRAHQFRRSLRQASAAPAVEAAAPAVEADDTNEGDTEMPNVVKAEPSGLRNIGVYDA